MDVARKKKIEKQLRQLIIQAEADRNPERGFGSSRSRGVQVIRRRKRGPARQAA